MSSSLSLFIEDSLLYANEFFAGFGEITRFSGKNIRAEDLSSADILLTRSTTKVSASLLAKADKLKFVGTATAGFDHIDQGYLNNKGITWTAAPGCNADAVADYVLSAMFTQAQCHNYNLSDKKIAIVGIGEIGSRLSCRLSALGCSPIQYDPVKASVDTSFQSIDFDAVLDADIISCHVPYTDGGDFPTQHMFDAETLAKLKSDCLLINACRGEIIDNQALKQHLLANNKFSVVLDVWENEPDIDMALLDLVSLATPHIAGHSLEGKARGTEMLYFSLCEFLNKEKNLNLQHFLPPMAVEEIVLSNNADLDDDLARDLTRFIYDIRNDHDWFKTKLKADPSLFSTLRKQYATRRELSSLKVITQQADLQSKLALLSLRK